MEADAVTLKCGGWWLLALEADVYVILIGFQGHAWVILHHASAE